MPWRRNPLGSRAGLQFSVEKINELLQHYGINELSKTDKIFITAVIEHTVYLLYDETGNHIASEKGRIYMEHFKVTMLNYKSDIFKTCENRDTNISMQHFTYILLKQCHPGLSLAKVVAVYIDKLINEYCEQLAKADLTNIDNTISTMFNKDTVLCENVIKYAKTAVDKFNGIYDY